MATATFMNTDSKQSATGHNLEMCQVDDKVDKPAKRERLRSGMGSEAYWKARLFRNSYRASDGRTVEIPEFYVRMRHAGQTRRVRLPYSDKDGAAEHALNLFHRLQSEGWSAVTDQQARLPASPTIEEFIEAYTTATASMEEPPRPITIHLYTRCLRQLCAVGGIERVRDLTTNAIEKFRDTYRARARAKKRNDASARNTLSTIIRNAAACFSREARAIMQRNGLVLTNPFEGVRTKVEIQPVSPLPNEIVKKIWAEAPLLRDGDPSAPDLDLKKYVKSYRKTHEDRLPGRWVPIDFRQPHPDAYAALLLALGCGLRANECDKSRWSWLKFDGQGNCFIEVQEEEDFRPKGGMRRIIKIPRELHDAIAGTRADMTSPYILGGTASTESSAKGAGFYRRMATIRTVNTWLRDRGVEADMKYGKPLHRLRKQFGSELATNFGLFAAQKLLGHSTPTITARHYAAQTELPTLTHVRIMG